MDCYEKSEIHILNPTRPSKDKKEILRTRIRANTEEHIANRTKYPRTARRRLLAEFGKDKEWKLEEFKTIGVIIQRFNKVLCAWFSQVQFKTAIKTRKELR